MSRAYRVATLALAVLLTAGAAQARQRTPETLRQLALDHDARNETAAALATLDVGLKAAPRDAGLLAAKGRIYWRLLRTNSAEQALVAAAKTPAYAAEAQYWLGRIYFFKGWRAEGAFPGWHEEVAYRPRAISAFNAARDRRPDWYLPHVGLGDALKADGRDADADAEYARAAALGQPDLSPPPDAVALADALIARVLANPIAQSAELRAAIDARIALRPDPMSYTTGANLLLAQRAELAHVAQLAEAGRAVGERFIRENESSYKLDGKVQGSLDRNAAAFADIAGWTAFLQKNIALAEKRLAEASRLSRGIDATNQMHLGELSLAKNDPETAREHYLTVLGLAAATAPQRESAKNALNVIQTKSGEKAAAFEKWLAATLDRRREERRAALIGNMAGRKMPPLVLTDLQGHTVDLLAERGNVVLLNFFSAW